MRLNRWRIHGGLASVLLALVAGAAPAGAQPRPERAPLTVAISDGVDGEAVLDRLAVELKRQVVPAPDGVCDLPCLSVSIDGNQAIVSFTPARGVPRARVVELGGDPAQWPVVITLLAGNVVRDEAADILALLPEPDHPGDLAPPAVPGDVPAISGEAPRVAIAIAPAPAATLSMRTPRRRAPHSRLIGFGFVPILSTDATKIGTVEHFVSADIIAGVSGGSTGFTVSGIADIERGPVSGVQLGGVYSYADSVSGTQLAGIAATAGDFHGVQVGGVAAVAGIVEGGQAAGVAAYARQADLQIAGVASFSRGGATTQIAGVASVATNAARIQIGGVATAARGRTNMQLAGVANLAGNANIQIGGVANVSRKDANIQAAGVASVGGKTNFQMSGVTNVAHRTANIQVAGVVNVARRLEGVQIAPINIARRVDGVQVGIVNVGSRDGFSFGLINIVPGGRADLEATVDSESIGTVLFRHGGRRWHNVYGVGGLLVDDKLTGKDNDDVWMYGLGFGPSFQIAGAIVDVEAIGWQVNHGKRHYDGISLLAQGRITVGYGIGPFKLVAGGAWNTYISSDERSPLILERRTPGAEEKDDVMVDNWPSAFVGLRI